MGRTILATAPLREGSLVMPADGPGPFPAPGEQGQVPEARSPCWVQAAQGDAPPGTRLSEAVSAVGGAPRSAARGRRAAVCCCSGSCYWGGSFSALLSCSISQQPAPFPVLWGCRGELPDRSGGRHRPVPHLLIPRELLPGGTPGAAVPGPADHVLTVPAGC